VACGLARASSDSASAVVALDRHWSSHWSNSAG
jgi:4-diphosphocytidyl-2C-methyl-D-erythritol kinase